MLQLPESSQTFATVVGIDPGSENLGVAELSFDIKTFEIINWEATTYVGSKLLKSVQWIEDAHGARYRRIVAHRKNLIKLFNQIEPLVIACESPFINMRRPQAYGALTEVVYEIRMAVMQYSPWSELYLLSPSSVKQGVGAMGNAGKDDVKISILKIRELVLGSTVPLASLDEHSIDALAVAYTAYTNLKINARQKPCGPTSSKQPSGVLLPGAQL